MVMQEGQDSRLELKDDDPEQVAIMIHYLYQLEYPVNFRNGEKLNFHVRMCVLADKYNMKHLQEAAAYAFVDDGIDAYRTNAYAAAVDEAYTYYIATEAIRKRIVDVMVRKPELISQHENYPPLRVVLTKHVQFAADIAEALLKRKIDEDSNSPFAAWYEHGDCDAFKADIEDDEDLKYSCPYCSKKMTGEYWQRYRNS